MQVLRLIFERDAISLRLLHTCFIELDLSQIVGNSSFVQLHQELFLVEFSIVFVCQFILNTTSCHPSLVQFYFFLLHLLRPLLNHFLSFILERDNLTRFTLASKQFLNVLSKNV